jgi:hypothetical protein
MQLGMQESCLIILLSESYILDQLNIPVTCLSD